MFYLPIAAELVRVVEQAGNDDRPARRPGLLHRVAVAFPRGKQT